MLLVLQRPLYFSPFRKKEGGLRAMKTEDLRLSSVREVIPSFPSQMALTQGALGREAQPLRRQLSCTPGVPWRGTNGDEAEVLWAVAWPLRTQLWAHAGTLFSTAHMVPALRAHLISSPSHWDMGNGHLVQKACERWIRISRRPHFPVGGEGSYFSWKRTSLQISQAHKPSPVAVRAQPGSRVRRNKHQHLSPYNTFPRATAKGKDWGP